MAACSLGTQAQEAAANTAPPVAVSAASATNPLSLRQAFDAAWARQPEAMALQARRDAARAQQRAAKAWTPESAALELSNKTDRLGSNQGAREFEVGAALLGRGPAQQGLEDTVLQLLRAFEEADAQLLLGRPQKPLVG